MGIRMTCDSANTNKNTVEERAELSLDFGKLANVAGKCPDVVPVAVQDIDTGEVILLAYTNETAFRLCMSGRKLVLWSTSRNELWEKGKTSGNSFVVVDAWTNCEQNSMLYRVRRTSSGICHTRNRKGFARNCYYRRINMNTLCLENTDP